MGRSQPPVEPSNRVWLNGASFEANGPGGILPRDGVSAADSKGLGPIGLELPAMPAPLRIAHPGGANIVERDRLFAVSRRLRKTISYLSKRYSAAAAPKRRRGSGKRSGFC